MTGIDLNDFSGGHHWLSPLGRVNRKDIRDRNRAKYWLNREPVHKLARPETIAKLHAVKARIEKRELFRKITVWNNAIAILDQSEVRIRDMIERDLVGVAGISGIRVGESVKAADRVAARVSAVRTKAIKKAFRYLRTKIGNVTIRGHSLAIWAGHFAAEDKSRIDKTIRVWLMAGSENTEIARQVVGSATLNGIDGMTAVTRHHISQLARAEIRPPNRRKRKSPK
jgi:hypothetical protein